MNGPAIGRGRFVVPAGARGGRGTGGVATPRGSHLRGTAQTFDDRRVFRDAQLLPTLPPGTSRVETRHSRIWIRIHGRWLAGDIQCWRRLPDGRWAAWLCYQADPEHPTVAPVWGHFLYDPEAILDRAEWPQPPA